MDPERPRLLPALLLSGFTVLVAAFASLPMEETATVTITAAPQRLQTNVLINVAAQHIDADITRSRHGTASVINGPAAYASGEVTFTYRCPATIVCKPVPYVLAGMVVASAEAVRYVTLAPALFTGPGETANAPVAAITPGAAGNTGAHTITIIEHNPDPGQLTVDNHSPITGGADPPMTQVIQQSDIDAVQRDLISTIADELNAALIGKAPGMVFVMDAPPSFDVRVDHAVGDAVATFTMTITGKAGAVAFSGSSAQALIRSALQPIIHPGYELPRSPIQATYQITQVVTNGSVTVRAAVVTAATPTLSAERLRARLKGLSLVDARYELEREFPGSQIDIRLKPVALPFLPLIAGHISPTLIVGPASA
jgi:hypothetical protein